MIHLRRPRHVHMHLITGAIVVTIAIAEMMDINADQIDTENVTMAVREEVGVHISQALGDEVITMFVRNLTPGSAAHVYIFFVSGLTPGSAAHVGDCHIFSLGLTPGSRSFMSIHGCEIFVVEL